MKQLIFLSVCIAFLTGCGGGSDSTESSSFNSSTVVMDIGEAYDVYPGDKVVKNSDTAILSVSHIDGHQEATLILQEGNASIIYR